MASTLTDRAILVTGGVGSFGRAFVRRALDCGARRIVVFSRDELKQSQMKAEFNDSRLRFFIGDVRDAERLETAMQGVEFVIHAAAMKRIEVCEEAPWEAVSTNVFGTRNVAMAAIRSGVQKAIFLSTDKAPAAATLYGSTKFTAERLWTQSNVYAAGTKTILSATRYGNVLNSRGSVLDLFKKQFEEGLPITITHPSMSRYWMTLDQAVDLVILALQNMRGGEVFIPKLPSAPLLHLIAAIAPGAHVRPIGLRTNERLHETLISEDEAPQAYDCGSHYVIIPANASWSDASPIYGIGKPVPANWSYRSDTNEEQYTVEELRTLVAA